MQGFDEEEVPTDLEQVRKMAKDAKNVLKSIAQKTRSKNYFLELYRELNSRQEKRYVNFAEDRWSIAPFLGYKQLTKDAIVTNAYEDE
jgi:hypothetical protein